MIPSLPSLLGYRLRSNDMLFIRFSFSFVFGDSSSTSFETFLLLLGLVLLFLLSNFSFSFITFLSSPLSLLASSFLCPFECQTDFKEGPEWREMKRERRKEPKGIKRTFIPLFSFSQLSLSSIVLHSLSPFSSLSFFKLSFSLFWRGRDRSETILVSRSLSRDRMDQKIFRRAWFSFFFFLLHSLLLVETEMKSREN